MNGAVTADREAIRRLLIDRQMYDAIPETLGYTDRLDLDSMALLWFLTCVEETFGWTVSPEELEGDYFQTVESIYRFFAGKAGEEGVC